MTKLDFIYCYRLRIHNTRHGEYEHILIPIVFVDLESGSVIL